MGVVTLGQWRVSCDEPGCVTGSIVSPPLAVDTGEWVAWLRGQGWSHGVGRRGSLWRPPGPERTLCPVHAGVAVGGVA